MQYYGDFVSNASLHLDGGFNPTPLKNDGVRQWEGWHPIYYGNFKTCLKNHQPVIVLFENGNGLPEQVRVTVQRDEVKHCTSSRAGHPWKQPLGFRIGKWSTNAGWNLHRFVSLQKVRNNLKHNFWMVSRYIPMFDSLNFKHVKTHENRTTEHFQFNQQDSTGAWTLMMI